MSKRPVDQPRRLAYDALRAVHGDGAYANLILAKLLSERHLTGRDAAFATELLSGTCRMEGTYDRIIAAAAGRKLTALQPAVLDLLRLGSHQLLAMRVPAHAAVGGAGAPPPPRRGGGPAGARGAAGGGPAPPPPPPPPTAVGERVTGLTNAILRKIATRDYHAWVDQLTAGQDRLDALSVRTAHPRWIVESYAELLPAEELAAALAANNVNPAVSLAVRPGLAPVDELKAAGAVAGQWSPFAASWSGNPGDLSAVRTGRAGVQDEGSQLLAYGLARADAAPGWWLDLCAGPGGKTALLAGLAAQDGSRLLAGEISPHRAQLVSQAVRAYGPTQRPALVIADGTRPAWPPGRFTRVLVDVPCSGLGALRRRPESRWRRGPADVEAMHPLQCALLQTALDSAAPGGLVAYVTCSPHVRETTDVVGEVLAARADVQLEDVSTVLPEVSDAARGPYLQLWPHRHGTDALFAAYLRRG